MALDAFLLRYLISWLAFCAFALYVGLRTVRPDWRAEAAFLTVPWKVALFVPAVLFVSLAGAFTDDETWDVGTGAGMALLTFFTAGWSVGTAYKVLRGERPKGHLIVAIALALFSSSWFYDGYLLLRDGAYTVRWFGNLRLSPIIYLCAGLVLNLEFRDGGLGLGLAFTRADWPKPASGRASWRMALVALPLVLIAAYVLVAFVGWRVPGR